MMVITQLHDGPRRFSQLRRSIDGISQRMLTYTLRSLERDGLVSRTVYPTIPPRVEYELTALGRAIIAPIAAVATWANEYYALVQQARDVYDASEREAKDRPAPQGPTSARLSRV